MSFLSRATIFLLAIAMVLDSRVGPAWPILGSPSASVLPPVLVAFGATGLLLRPNPPTRHGAATVGPMLAVLVALPTLGALVMGFPIQTLYAIFTPLLALLLIRIGKGGDREGRLVDLAVFWSVLLHSFYAIAQAADRAGVLPAGAWSWANHWDSVSQAALGEAYIQSSRSTGLFLNPNTLAMWSAVALVYCIHNLRGPKRTLAFAASSASIIVSQSRTGLLCLAIIILMLIARQFASGRVKPSPAVVFSILATAAALLAFGADFIGQLLVQNGLSDRVSSGIKVATEGLDADTNLSARIDAWYRVFEATRNYPLGTMGPPQLVIDSLIDNQYVLYYAQGGVVLLALFLLALSAPWRARAGLEEGEKKALSMLAIVIAISSFTAPVLSASAVAIAPAWLLVGRAARRLTVAPGQRTDGPRTQKGMTERA